MAIVLSGKSFKSLTTIPMTKFVATWAVRYGHPYDIANNDVAIPTARILMAIARPLLIATTMTIRPITKIFRFQSILLWSGYGHSMIKVMTIVLPPKSLSLEYPTINQIIHYFSYSTYAHKINSYNYAVSILQSYCTRLFHCICFYS